MENTTGANKIETNLKKRLDLSKPRWDQSTYKGRANHFFTTTNPLNVLASDKELDAAKDLVLAYKEGREPEGTTDEQVWAAKNLYDSAFHPETGEKLFILGRMSFQVPGNMTITGAMMTFYKTTPAVLFWQWANQSFNAMVNYTNRSASSEVSMGELGQAYVLATGGAMATALGLNKLVASSPALSASMIGRFVPLCAVAAANCINIPCMRQRELIDGITVKTAEGDEGKPIGLSKAAAKSAITQVVPSRVLMATPAMFIPPLAMARLEKTAMLIKNPWLKAPLTMVLTGLCLSVSTPACCALFPQESSLPVSSLEPELQGKISKEYPGLKTVYFNKGL
mmetsp:Transcript_16311/g.21581  ORF Transcript_16311/g.21581 Transcript_16311/m.21581 type:complete len:339 (-) Transcript_16311:228-1244(-)